MFKISYLPFLRMQKSTQKIHLLINEVHVHFLLNERTNDSLESSFSALSFESLSVSIKINAREESCPWSVSRKSRKGAFSVDIHTVSQSFLVYQSDLKEQVFWTVLWSKSQLWHRSSFRYYSLLRAEIQSWNSLSFWIYVWHSFQTYDKATRINGRVSTWHATCKSLIPLPIPGIISAP